MFKFVKLMFAFVFVIILGSIVFRAYMVIDSKNNNKSIYEITVNRGESSESYLTSDYTVQGECIKFKDEFGIRKTICGHYTISEY